MEISYWAICRVCLVIVLIANVLSAYIALSERTTAITALWILLLLMSGFVIHKILLVAKAIKTTGDKVWEFSFSTDCRDAD